MNKTVEKSAEAEEPQDFETAFGAFANEGDAPAAEAEQAEEHEDEDAGADAGEGAEGDQPETGETDEGDSANGDHDGAEGGDADDQSDPPPAQASREAGDPQDPTAQLSDDELLRRFSALVRKADQSQESQQPPAKQEQQAEPEIYTDEEKTFLAQYEQDFPDVARAEQLRRRSEYRQLVQYMFNEVSRNLQPIAETVETLSNRAHLTELQTRVEDYDTIRDRVLEWVEAEPAFLQDGYKRVIESGTADEVAALIERFRQATGASSAKADPGQTPPKKDRELPSSARKAAAALAPVRSKRTPPVAGIDPDDFESAFEKFAAKM